TTSKRFQIVLPGYGPDALRRSRHSATHNRKAIDASALSLDATVQSVKEKCIQSALKKKGNTSSKRRVKVHNGRTR
ncbi:MAG: hypothetical protein ACRCUC_02320, partial [Aestuariivirga sp.]